MIFDVFTQASRGCACSMEKQTSAPSGLSDSGSGLEKSLIAG